MELRLSARVTTEFGVSEYTSVAQCDGNATDPEAFASELNQLFDAIVSYEGDLNCGTDILVSALGSRQEKQGYFSNEPHKFFEKMAEAYKSWESDMEPFEDHLVKLLQQNKTQQCLGMTDRAAR